jgi:hypothetical protein
MAAPAVPIVCLCGDDRLVGIEGRDVQPGSRYKLPKIPKAIGSEASADHDRCLKIRAGRNQASSRSGDLCIEIVPLRFVRKDSDDGGGIYNHQTGAPRSS